MSRIKMPHNNRMSSSTALKTNDIWSKTIGYDPYANNEEEIDKEKNSVQAESLLLLARISNLSGVESRGGCKRCGMLGHLTYQCRNPVQSQEAEKESESSSDEESDQEDSILRKRSSPLRTHQKEEEEDRRERKRRREKEASDSDREESGDESRGSRRKKDKKEKKQKKNKTKKSKKHKKEKH